MVKAAKTVTTIATKDRETINAATAFGAIRGGGPATEALEKLVQRAVRLRLHRMPDAEFEAFVERISAVPSSL